MTTRAIANVPAQRPESIADRITSDTGTCGGKPRITGTRIRVQDVYVLHELRGLSPDQIIQEFPQLEMADVHAALAYYWDHQEDVQRQLKEEADLIATLRAKLGPGPLEQSIGPEA